MVNHIQINGIPPRIRYVADGTDTVFSFSFAIFNDDNIKVYCGDVLQASTAYTVSIANNVAGGSVTFTTAPASGTVVTLVRDLTIERTTDFQESGALRANVLNDELDYQIACQQQIADSLNRSMVLPPYAVGTDVNLTLPTPNAGKAIVWNAAGTNLENSALNVDDFTTQLATATTAATTATTQATTATTKASEAAASATTAGTAATTATNAMANKANKDMDNLTATGQSTLAGMGMPSDTYINVTISGNMNTYTAPANGYICATTGISTGTTLDMSTSISMIKSRIGVSTSYTRQFIPVKAGDICYIGCDGGFIDITFIYAVGSEP